MYVNVVFTGYNSTCFQEKNLFQANYSSDENLLRGTTFDFKEGMEVGVVQFFCCFCFFLPAKAAKFF